MQGYYTFNQVPQPLTMPTTAVRNTVPQGLLQVNTIPGGYRRYPGANILSFTSTGLPAQRRKANLAEPCFALQR